MTFSANPARTTLRDRLRRLTGPQRALFNVIATSLLLMLGATVLALFLVRAVVHEQAAQLGGALASESARRAAEYLVHDDLVSLNVITGGLTHLPGVVGVTIFDRHRQPLAQSGLVQQTPGLLVASADILTEENDLRGTVEILIDPRGALPALSRFDYTLLGWLGFAVVLLLMVARLQRDNLGASSITIATPPPAPEIAAEEESALPPAEDESPLAHLPDGPLLRIDIVNYATMEQRLAPHVLNELVELYSDTLARACAYYQGQVQRPINHQGLVAFPLAGSNEDEALFRAVCCAQLFFGVVRDINEDRRARGKVTLQFTAALHNDPSLGNEGLAIVTWEICTQAGTAGRLTVTDSVSDHPLLGERLVLDGGNRHLLQIELRGEEGGENRLQDVLALGVLRLADPYEELLARQVKRLAEPVTG
ncbi:MAG: hypothetical protein ACLGHJ_01770 [Gammaproteobacteria bacterium]